MNTNFTSPDQSQHLLDLGLPASSSDCYYTQTEIEWNMYWFEIHLKREYQPHSSLHSLWIPKDILPCWSFGQLLQIYRTCVRPDQCIYLFEGDEFPDIMTEILWKICNAIESGKFDFSKLKSK